MVYYKKAALLFFISCSVIFSGCATLPQYSTFQESLSDLCRQTNIQFAYDPVIRSVKLSLNGVKVYALVDSDIVMVGSERIMLESPISLRHGEIYVSQDFREKILCRIDKSVCADRKRSESFIIVIDPGHGGKDSGAVGAYHLKEKDVVLDIAERMTRKLKQYGYDVRMTRNSDKFISLEKRTEYAAQWNADLFVSIHANASKSSRAVGFEVWAPRVLTHEDFNEAQRKKNNRIMFGHLNMQRQNLLLEKTLSDMLYQYKYAESLKLAGMISKNCSKGIVTRNRGVKQSGFFVLRNTLIPSILVEVGFISNRREARRLKSSSYRQEIAEMLVEGIKGYVRSL